MLLAPVIDRELSRSMRWKTGAKSRFRVALLGTIVVVCFFAVNALGHSPAWGRNLHQIFLLAGLYLAIAPALRISVGLFSEERRNQTLELLFLTGLTPAELFFGKLFGGIVIASSDLLALAPLLAVPFLLGGVSIDLYVATLACLPALLLFTVASGVLASVLCKDDGVAFVLTLLLAGCVNLAAPIPYYLGNLLTGASPIASRWLCLSPAYAPYLASIYFGLGKQREFWNSILSILSWSAVFLALACFILNRNWRSEVRGSAKPRWQVWIDARIHSARSWQTAVRNRMLEANPFEWLVQQDRRPVLLGWCAVGAIGILWLVGWRTWPQAWPSNANFFITAMVLIAIVTWLKFYAGARRLGMDRRDGILELLLTTPLSPEKIVDGTVAAMEREFAPLQRAVVGLFLLMMIGGFVIRSWNARAAITYLAIWLALGGWCLSNSKSGVLKVMWAALNTGRPVHAITRLRGNKLSLFWIFYNLRALINAGFGRGTSGFPTGSSTEFLIVCLIGIPVAAAWYLWRGARVEIEQDTRKRMIMEMRLIATEPLPDPGSPGYNAWETIRRIPYHGGTVGASGVWPLFVDPPETGTATSARLLNADRALVTPDLRQLEDALALFRLLNQKHIDFMVVGQMAMNLLTLNQTARDTDVIMAESAISAVSELYAVERAASFCFARFREIRVIIYLRSNAFFEAIQKQFAATTQLDGLTVPMVTADGLIALNLFAIHKLSQQHQFYRQERYEVEIIALLASSETSTENILTLVRAHVPEQHVEELEDTLGQCEVYAAKLRKRHLRTPANASVSNNWPA